jgi:hypothetical protein
MTLVPARRCIAVAALAATLSLAVPATAAELVMVERAGCPVCMRWNRELGAVYPNTPEAARAPLRRLDLAAAGTLTLVEPVRYTPTFLLVEDGQEVGRITGYTGDDAFWGLLGRLLSRSDGVTQSP